MHLFRKLLGRSRQILLFAVLLQSLKYGGGQAGQGQPINSCENTLEDPVYPCYRCESHKWLYMASSKEVDSPNPPIPGQPPEKCSKRRFFRGSEQCDGVPIVDPKQKEQTSCFNFDPVETLPPTITMAENLAIEVELDSFKSAIGFTIPEAVLFRYFLPPQAHEKGQIELYDIGQVRKYYIDVNTPKTYDTDFELFEWPGKTSTQFRGFLESVTKGSYSCVDDDTNVVNGEIKCNIHHEYIMLAYDKPTAKFSNYPCNALRGTHVVAYGHTVDLKDDYLEQLKDKEGSPFQKFYISHGMSSIHYQYIQPLYVRNVTLRLMGNSKVGDDCMGTDVVADWTHLRTILDFTFSTGRVILGMKCGILIVDNIMEPSFIVFPAKLLTEDKKSSNFPEPITTVASSVCCDSVVECSKETHIVAAYSSKYDKMPDDLKFLYISFDRGNNFETKLIAPVSSLINLIQSMYRIYDRWDFYYKILEVEDSVHSKYSDHSSLKNIRKDLLNKYSEKYHVWDALNPEEKEEFMRSFAHGTNKEDIWKHGSEELADIACQKFKDFINNPEISKDNDNPPSPSMLSGVWNPDTDYTPDWVKESIAKRYKEFVETNVNDQTSFNKSRWNQAYCDTIPECKEQFEEDKVVAELTKLYEPNDLVQVKDCGINSEEKWKERTKTYTKKQNSNEPFCIEIVSIVVLQEEQSLLMLCRVGYCESKDDCSKVPPPSDSGTRYAIYKALLRPKVPIISPFRRSERIFQCIPLQPTLENHVREIFPEMVTVPKSSSIVITFCKKVLIFSPNGGRTIFNMIFYFREENLATGTPVYSRSTYFEELTVPTSAAMDPLGHTTLITFSNYYMYGVFNSNREFRLIVGKIFERPGKTGSDATISDTFSPGENGVIPWFKNSGSPALSLILIEFLREQKEYKEFYKDRPAIRFVNVPISFYDNIKPFFTENLRAFEQGRIENKLYPDCSTYAFSVEPKSIELDIGESAMVEVAVTDEDPLVPLGIFANDENGLRILVELIGSKKKGQKSTTTIIHYWDVTVTSVRHYRSSEEARIDAFFGSDYINVAQRSSNIVLVNFPTMRCHVQPSGSVKATIGCLGKIMVAHEDEFREQCKFTFVNNFKYTLEKGQYDPEMARYWLENNPEFVKRDNEGNLEIVYDFGLFGCPIEPYQEDNFTPDLRILDENIRRNSSLGRRFNGSFVLIEIFGATGGYNYSLKVKDVDCKSRPQNFKTMLRDWTIRRRIFNITSNRMKRWLPDPTVARFSSGSLLFDDTGVNEHINIWNRVNYRSCNEPGQKPLTEEDMEEEYEIMNNGNLDLNDLENLVNKISWSQKKRPKVFMFLAVAIDNDDTFCNYYTMFGVSLPKSEELDDLWSFICFLIFILFWILLVILGYWCRKSYIRKQYVEEARADRLKQAAWTVIYRYEKLLQESDKKNLE